MSFVCKIKLYGLVVVLLCAVFVLYVLRHEQRGNILEVIMLNVGQGDAIFIQTPSGNQVIVDGGPGKNIMSELKEVLPFYDRTVDMIIVTNPDADHLTGFIEVLNQYKVSHIVEPGTLSKTATYAEFKRLADKEEVSDGVKAKQHIARRGMKLVLDQKYQIYLEILFPDRDVSAFSTNDGSIIMRLRYGGVSYMFMGDAPQKAELHVMSLGDVKADVLKIGHHGSKTSSNGEFVKAVAPELALISAGYKNKYGHPHKDVLDTLRNLNVPYLVTSTHGRIKTSADGKMVKVDK